MPQNLLDQTVESTYQGVLHAEGAALPIQGNQIIYDGSGQASALALGVLGNGAEIAGGLSISGRLSSGILEFTNVDAASGRGFPLVTDGSGNVDFGQITVDALPDLDPDPQGSYDQIDTIVLNSKGLVEQVYESPIRQCWVNFDGKPITAVTYTIVQDISSKLVSCNKGSHGLANGQIISLTATDAKLNGAYPVTVDSPGTFSFPLPEVVDPLANSGTLAISTTIRSSYNIDKVTRNKAGNYTVWFNNTFNNNSYMVQVTKGSHVNPADNPASPATGNNGWTTVLEQLPDRVKVFSQNGDCTNMNVLVIGNTLIYEVDQPQLFYTTYSYENYYEILNALPQRCTIDSGDHTYLIDANYMRQNKLIAVEISIRGSDASSAGFYKMSMNTSVVGVDDNTYNSSFKRTTGIGDVIYGRLDRCTAIILYLDNKLYYKNFYIGINDVVTTIMDYRTKDVNIPPQPDRRFLEKCYKNKFAAKATTSSYLTTIINKYGLYSPSIRPDGFREIKSASVTTNLFASYSGYSWSYMLAFKYIKKFYIPQPS
jgi:hypothetical protein